MIEKGKRATYMKDKKGYLPIHVAVSRHVSPDKLRMLLDANPKSIVEKTNDGMTLLGLAQQTATRSHPVSYKTVVQQFNLITRQFLIL